MTKTLTQHMMGNGSNARPAAILCRSLGLGIDPPNLSGRLVFRTQGAEALWAGIVTRLHAMSRPRTYRGPFHIRLSRYRAASHQLVQGRGVRVLADQRVVGREDRSCGRVATFPTGCLSRLAAQVAQSLVRRSNTDDRNPQPY